MSKTGPLYCETCGRYVFVMEDKAERRIDAACCYKPCGRTWRWSEFAQVFGGFPAGLIQFGNGKRIAAIIKAFDIRNHEEWEAIASETRKLCVIEDNTLANENASPVKDSFIDASREIVTNLFRHKLPWVAQDNQNGFDQEVVFYYDQGINNGRPHDDALYEARCSAVARILQRARQRCGPTPDPYKPEFDPSSVLTFNAKTGEFIIRAPTDTQVLGAPFAHHFINLTTPQLMALLRTTSVLLTKEGEPFPNG